MLKPVFGLATAPASMSRWVAVAVALIAPVVHASAGDVSAAWQEQVLGMKWIAYSSPSADPTKGVEAAPKIMQEELALLRKAGFGGLVSYGSSGVFGRELPRLAEAQGFRGIIIGVWDPKSTNELASAKAAAKSAIVVSVCVGNEGLRSRYNLQELRQAIEDVRQATGKPVTTSEQIEHYSDPELLRVGDWVFPTVHPYFHHELAPKDAMQWTVEAYTRLKKKTDKLVLFKEVGLPTAGAPGEQVSEASQDLYYSLLERSDVRFVYFEAFDLPWKRHLPVEPHWGIFRADRSPKLLAKRLLGMATGVPPGRSDLLYVYLDGGSKTNHFVASGYMGDCGDIKVDESWKQNPHSGATCIKVVYSAVGKGPNKCDYPPPCKWAGVPWQLPANNWGVDPLQKGKGMNLSAYDRLGFWARADKPCTVDFKVGGVSAAYGDSLQPARELRANLTTDWQEFVINLEGADLKHIIGGFGWVSNWDSNPNGATFYLDDIRFERKGGSTQ